MCRLSICVENRAWFPPCPFQGGLDILTPVTWPLPHHPCPVFPLSVPGWPKHPRTHHAVIAAPLARPAPSLSLVSARVARTTPLSPHAWPLEVRATLHQTSPLSDPPSPRCACTHFVFASVGPPSPKHAWDALHGTLFVAPYHRRIKSANSHCSPLVSSWSIAALFPSPCPSVSGCACMQTARGRESEAPIAS